MQQYRRLLGLPGVRTLMILMFFARIPVSAAGMTLTLHVAVGMDRGYGQAGLVGAASTVGIAIGAPIMGRVVDRYGLRPMLVAVTIGETAFWLAARHMSYPVLLVAAFAGGLVIVPAMSIGRQAIAALVPENLRRSAYSLDSVSVELSFMVGPAAAVLLATQVSTGTATTAMAGAVFLVGVTLIVVNPRIRADHEITEPGAGRVPRRTWLTPQLVGVLAIGAGAVFVLSGTEVALVAALRGSGQLDWTGVVVMAMCVASAVGGLVHGAVKRSLPQVVLMALLGLLAIPVGLAGEHWWLLALALIPTNLLCAPTLASTGEQVSNLAPPAQRGEATGLQSSAFTLGTAVGSPLVGFVVDHSTPAWGFAVAGLGGVLVACVAMVLIARGNRRATPDAAARKGEPALS
ncbi:MFS transporter [Actinokineospora sp.]|uniref:MFS transporter n=1 Tax=Actinokineospora sp. TaxID=1872133 RepID=UPI004037C84D